METTSLARGLLSRPRTRALYNQAQILEGRLLLQFLETVGQPGSEAISFLVTTTTTTRHLRVLGLECCLVRDGAGCGLGGRDERVDSCLEFGLHLPDFRGRVGIAARLRIIWKQIFEFWQ